jgi:hypothetical protein
MNPSGPGTTALYTSMHVCSTQALSGELRASAWYNAQSRERLDLCSESTKVRYFFPRRVLYKNRNIIIDVPGNARIVPCAKVDDLITRKNSPVNFIFSFDIRQQQVTSK